MAINITKKPSGIYPAYNDSFIEFNSSLSGADRAEITAFPSSLFTKTFTVFPDLDGVFVFNLKNIVKAVMNLKSFEDLEVFYDSFYGSIDGNYLFQVLEIEVFNELGNETIDLNYEFFRSVKQIGENIFDNRLQILSHSENGVDFALTYFEGFPFFTTLQRVIHSSGKTILVRNKNNQTDSGQLPTSKTGSFRLNIDRGEGLNWTSKNFLPLKDGLNRLEIFENDVFKNNLLLTKKKPCNGVYLKWFNLQGDYNFWLFEEYFTRELKVSNRSYISENKFENVGSVNSNFLTTGKEASAGLRIKTSCNQIESKVLESLFLSPFVQMWSSNEANSIGRFLNVQINENFKSSNKKGMNQYTLNVDLPEVITATL